VYDLPAESRSRTPSSIALEGSSTVALWCIYPSHPVMNEAMPLLLQFGSKSHSSTTAPSPRSTSTAASNAASCVVDVTRALPIGPITAMRMPRTPSSSSEAARDSNRLRSGPGGIIAPHMIAQSLALRANGPGVSKVCASGTIPCVDSKFFVVLRPTVPQKAAGNLPHRVCDGTSIAAEEEVQSLRRAYGQIEHELQPTEGASRRRGCLLYRFCGNWPQTRGFLRTYRTEPPVSVPTAQGTWKEATETPEPLELPPGTRCEYSSGYVHGLTGVPMC